MLTKQEIVSLLMADTDITNYHVFKADMSSGNLYPISQEDVMKIMVRCIDAYENVIKHVLFRLDESNNSFTW